MANVLAPDNELDIATAGVLPFTRPAVIAPEGGADYIPGTFIGTGSETIAGDITVGGAAPAYAFAILLRESDGMPIGYSAIAGDGTYEFVAVGAGNYAVVILDATGTKRAKVLHTIVTEPE